jgi:hypothetical protein
MNLIEYPDGPAPHTHSDRYLLRDTIVDIVLYIPLSFA